MSHSILLKKNDKCGNLILDTSEILFALIGQIWDSSNHDGLVVYMLRITVISKFYTNKTNFCGSKLNVKVSFLEKKSLLFKIKY